MLRHQIHQIRTKMLLVMVAMLVIITSTLAVFIYRESTRVMEDTYHSISQNSLIACSDVLDLQLNFIVDLVRSKVLSEAFFRNVPPVHSGTTSSRLDNAAMVRANEILGQMLAQEPLLDGFWFFDLQEHRLSAMASKRQMNSLFEYYAQSLDASVDWYQRTIAANGKEVFFGYNVLWSTDEQSFSMTKLIRDTDNFDGIGVLVTTINKKMLNDLTAHWRSDEEAAMMIVDEDKMDQLIFYNQPEAKQVLQHYLNQRDQERSGDYLFQTHKAERSRWSFISFIHKDHLSSAGQYIQSYIAIVLIGILFLGVMMSLITTYFLYRPIERLKRSIQQFGQDHQPITTTFDESEVGTIGNAIKKAVNQNLELSKRVTEAEVREKESELRLLQAQINPHFLYNTLDSLYLMAVMHNVDEIAEMTAALSDIFKIALSKGNRYIRLNDELEYIQQYMLIQNIRFSNRFKLEIEADAQSRQCFMLKLIIQPFVENAICHGLEPKMGNGWIRVCARIDDAHLHISIADNGVGVQDISLLDHGYAISNVRERIQLFYGSAYDVKFYSEPEKGVTVLIRIPVWPEERYASLGV